jgi:hypothetical protein
MQVRSTSLFFLRFILKHLCASSSVWDFRVNILYAFLLSFTHCVRPWRWRQCFSPKHWCVSITRRDVTVQKMSVLFLFNFAFSKPYQSWKFFGNVPRLCQHIFLKLHGSFSTLSPTTVNYWSFRVPTRRPNCRYWIQTLIVTLEHQRGVWTVRLNFSTE